MAYPTTLFTPAKGEPGAYAAKSTMFTANIAAGLMLEQFRRHFRRIPVDQDLSLDLFSMELTVTRPWKPRKCVNP